MDARVERVWTPRVTDDGVAAAAEGNTWLIGDDDEVIVIDPGEDADEVLDAVGDRDILAVICTHGHESHIAAAVDVAEGYADDADDDEDSDDDDEDEDEDEDYLAPVALHRADRLLWRTVHDGDDPEIEMADGGRFDVADVWLEVIHTPGHTPGSVSLYCPALEAVFTGDALTASGPVPHEGAFPDFPRQLTAIGERLLDLPPQTRVLSGHGEESTIGDAVKRFDSWVAAGPDLSAL